MADKPEVIIIPAKQKFYYNVAIYCRVSSRSQEQLNSLANQISFLTRKVVTTIGWLLYDIYIDVRSGSDTENRDQFQRMLVDCKTGKIDIILTKSISRFGRNTEEVLSAIKLLTASNIEIIFDQEDLRTSDPNSSLLISILEGVAQEESKSRSQNIRWGIKRKVENGTSNMFKKICYGYTNDDLGELSINEFEAEIVNLIFQLYLSGKSILGIIRELEQRKIKSPTGKDKWCKRSIDMMLSNEKYCGDVIVFKTYNFDYPKSKRKTNNGEHEKFISTSNNPAIITKEIFNKVQEEKIRRSNLQKNEDGTESRKASRYSSKSKADTNFPL